MILLIEISLLPEQRGKGVGAQLIEGVIAEATSAGKRVSLTVEQQNPAIRLYQRLGFTTVEERPPYLLMTTGRS